MAQEQPIQKQAILLDLSLFILDILDADKIKKNIIAHDHILEVPSALALMMRDLKSGSPALFLFIHSLLNKFIQKHQGKQNNDPRIVTILNSSAHQIRERAWRASQNLYDNFAPLIEGVLSDASLSNQPEYERGEVIYSIKRYDFVGVFSDKEQKKLQKAYTKELSLPTHPLYDLYFAQIYHAQATGTMNFSNSHRKNISLGNETFQVISTWKEEHLLHYKKDASIIERSRDILKWFTFTYIKDEWKNIGFDTSLGLSVEFVTAGAVGISFVTLTTGTIILKGITQIPDHLISPTERIIVFIVFAFIFFACLLLGKKPAWIILFPEPTPSPTYTQIPAPLYTSSVAILPTATLIPPTSTTTPFPTILPTPTSSAIPVPNYCLYVTQSGDTAQSISAWFGISESDYRATNNSHPGTEFTAPHMVTIHAPCCNSQYPNGISYTVIQGDTVYSLAEDNGITSEYLKTANRLQSSYIQIGQMLCIP